MKLADYLTPSERTEAYTKSILLEGFNAIKQEAEGADEVALGKETCLHIKKHCLARTYWLIENHPEDKELIIVANKYAAQLIEHTMRKFTKMNGKLSSDIPLS